MRHLAPLGLLTVLIVLAAAGVPAPALATCAQATDGRCQAPGDRCTPPADGRCHTMAASSLSSLSHACRCVSPRQYGPHAAAPGQKSCRQRCNSRDLVCESNARNFTQRNNCVSRMTSCDSHC
jgi:hypothetical protein